MPTDRLIFISVPRLPKVKKGIGSQLYRVKVTSPFFGFMVQLKPPLTSRGSPGTLKELSKRSDGFRSRLCLKTHRRNCRGGTPWPPVVRKHASLSKLAATECRPYS